MPGPWEKQPMIVTSTPTIEGRPVVRYLGLVTGEAVMGANIFRDMFAGIRDIVGGRAGAYENVLRGGRDQAISEMMEEAEKLGADAIIGVDFGYSALGATDSMLLVACNGTAVKLG